ncbi:hypothetical protein B4077_4035 [Bacillus cereus]|uniref:Uncharacterized protein n=1 Tax=Bacillus cereus TaxID=1396 RepID=A0A0G8F302_BACCE|nr:hypothetical protein B4077_4035 [Bacillus cereus]
MSMFSNSHHFFFTIHKISSFLYYQNNVPNGMLFVSKI